MKDRDNNHRIIPLILIMWYQSARLITASWKTTSWHGFASRRMEEARRRVGSVAATRRDGVGSLDRVVFETTRAVSIDSWLFACCVPAERRKKKRGRNQRSQLSAVSLLRTWKPDFFWISFIREVTAGEIGWFSWYDPIGNSLFEILSGTGVCLGSDRKEKKPVNRKEKIGVVLAGNIRLVSMLRTWCAGSRGHARVCLPSSSDTSKIGLIASTRKSPRTKRIRPVLNQDRC